MLKTLQEFATEIASDPLIRLNERWLEVRNTSRRWEVIRAAYRGREEQARRGELHPWLLEWNLTPIERNAWEDIRFFGLTLYPQFPVGRRFIDFADPNLCIGVEIDGRAYHQYERDASRDFELQLAGWSMFHIPGRNTFSAHPDPFLEEWERVETGDYDDDGFRSRVFEWGRASSGGFFWALQYTYYDPRPDDEKELLTTAKAILRANRLTLGRGN